MRSIVSAWSSSRTKSKAERPTISSGRKPSSWCTALEIQVMVPSGESEPTTSGLERRSASRRPSVSHHRIEAAAFGHVGEGDHHAAPLRVLEQVDEHAFEPAVLAVAVAGTDQPGLGRARIGQQLRPSGGRRRAGRPRSISSVWSSSRVLGRGVADHLLDARGWRTAPRRWRRAGRGSPRAPGRPARPRGLPGPGVPPPGGAGSMTANGRGGRERRPWRWSARRRGRLAALVGVRIELGEDAGHLHLGAFQPTPAPLEQLGGPADLLGQAVDVGLARTPARPGSTRARPAPRRSPGRPARRGTGLARRRSRLDHPAAGRAPGQRGDQGLPGGHVVGVAHQVGRRPSG